MIALSVVISLALFVKLSRQARATGLAPDQRRARAAIVATFRARAREAISVAYCESRLHPAAIGGVNVGLFQVNYPAHRRPGETFQAFARRFQDLGTNVRFAYSLSAGGRDWSAWTCRP